MSPRRKRQPAYYPRECPVVEWPWNGEVGQPTGDDYGRYRGVWWPARPDLRFSSVADIRPLNAAGRELLAALREEAGR